MTTEMMKRLEARMKPANIYEPLFDVHGCPADSYSFGIVLEIAAVLKIKALILPWLMEKELANG